MNPMLVEAQDLAKRYRINGTTIPVFSDINFSIRHNEVLCILGPSGCGKTTIARILSGFERDYEGTVSFCGESIEGPSTDRILLMQDLALYNWMTVMQNIGFGLLIRKEPRAVIEEQCREIISLFGLQGFENALPKQLSGGMKQRVALARALVINPKLLILDEPFSSLDEVTKNGIMKLLLKIMSAREASMLIITHNINEASVLADRVLILEGSNPALIKKSLLSPFAHAYEKRETLLIDDVGDFKADMLAALQP